MCAPNYTKVKTLVKKHHYILTEDILVRALDILKNIVILKVKGGFLLNRLNTKAYLKFTFYIFDLLRNVLTNQPLTLPVNATTLYLYVH